LIKTILNKLSGGNNEYNKFKLQVLDKIPTPVMAIDKDFNVLYMNEPAAHAVGSTPDKVKGRKCFSLFNTAHCNTANCQCDKAMREQQNCTSDTVAKLPSGELPIRYTGTPLKDENGSVIGALEYVTNIAEEYQAVEYIGKIAADALEGKLDTRGNPDDYQINGFVKVIEGLNATLDAIVAPIVETCKVLETAADKNLTDRIEGDYKGQLDDLKNNVNITINSLDEALQQVGQAVEQVSSASEQISSGSQSLAQGANEQASSLEEISSSLEEMSSMTKQNADNADQAKTLSGSARESADKGSSSMEQMTDAINRIKNSSDETAKIVKTIDEIAFQTNLLALNAAVEAARAGEAGKGFAVVAEEVRNLAQRSAEAAKNTTELIDGAVKNAENGVLITNQVAAVLTEIVDGSGKVNDLVAEISAAAGEQAQGIEQVNTAVSQMDQVTQLNASNSEESASAAEELNSQATELQRMVSAFVLSQVTSTNQRKSATPSTPAAQIRTQKRKSGNRLHKFATQEAGNKGNGNKRTAKPSDELIPLDDDDFGDF
jgi:methyl-accepting chemotaxis protein